MNGIVADIRYGARLLVSQRGFAAVAVLTTGLAIGVTATLFSVFDAVLLRPLPWSRADRLVRLTETHIGATRQMPLLVTSDAYLAMNSLTTAAGLGAWNTSTATIASSDGSERVRTALVTPGTFAILDATPLAGRIFTTDDAAEVILSYGLWLSRFGGAPDAVGRSVLLNGFPVTIVGVMRHGFAFPDPDTRLWRPLRIPRPPATTLVSAMARLSDGASPDQISAEATAAVRRTTPSTNMLLAFFGSSGPAQIAAEPVLEALTRDVRPGMIAMFAAAWLLLVMAVANLASLELARATTRYREIAIRSALGAGTRRVIQQLVVEQLLLATVGGALGLALTIGLHRALPSVLPADFPRLQDVAMRLPVVAFAFGLASSIGILLGALPALHMRRLRLAQALGEGSGSIGGTRTRIRARSWIMTIQIAVASALLIIALLLGRTFVAMISQDRGFTSEHLLTARLSLPDFAFTPSSRIDAVETFVTRSRTLPGAPIVAATTGMPLSGSEYLTGFNTPSLRPPVGTIIHLHAVRSVVTADYVRALGLRLVAGRDFRADDDSPSAPRVVIVNRRFAREYLTDQAIGDRIRNFMDDDQTGFQVIGIVDDMMRGSLTDRVQPEIYSLLRQSIKPSSAQDVVMRTAVGASQLAEPLRRLVREIAPKATIDSIRTMDDRIEGSLARPRLYALLLAAFAGSALVIAAVGLVGVLSYSVALRSREIALRMALGAKPRQILALVFSQGLTVTAVGITAGLAAAAVAVRYVATLVYGVSTHDAVSFIAAPLTLAILALAACTAPAVRAARIDPLTKLRG